MKKVININFHGRVIPIEETAYEILKQYIESLRKFFALEEGKDEIINDIESRISELFSETLKKGSPCITESDVETIIASIGRPEDFEAEDGTASAKEAAGNQQSTTGNQQATGSRGRLYRDENDKLIGGVCAGLASYFRVDPSIMRILFALITFGGFGTGFLIYIILWIILPSKTLETQLRKRLFRNPDDKVIGGVASGIAAYFNISVWIPRLIFALPLVLGLISSVFRNIFFDFDPFPSIIFGSFGGSLFIIYIVLWAVIPQAQTSTEKLEMRGERVDLNTIKSTIQEDLGNLRTRTEKWGSEVKETFQTKSRAMASELSPAVRRGGNRLGHAIGVIFKGFFLFIAGAIAFALLMVMIVLIFTMIGVMAGGVSAFPFKDFIISGPWQNALAWTTLLLFLGVPVIAFIVWILRRLSRVKSHNPYLGYTFGSLWIIGLIAGIFLAASISSDYKTKAGVEEKLTVTQPQNQKLLIKAVSRSNVRYFDDDWYGIHWGGDNSPFYALTEDSIVLRTVQLRVQKSEDSLFHLTIIKLSRGANPQSAKDAATKIDFTINQVDSIVSLPRGFDVSKSEKFKNQQVLLIVDVPMGKEIEIDHTISEYKWFNIDMGNGYNDWDWDDDWHNRYDWSSNVEYIMTNDGLKPTHPSEINNNNDDEQNDENAPDSSPDNSDTTKYHYQPANDSQHNSIKKQEVKAKESIQTPVQIKDIASSFFERLSL